MNEDESIRQAIRLELLYSATFDLSKEPQFADWNFKDLATIAFERLYDCEKTRRELCAREFGPPIWLLAIKQGKLIPLQEAAKRVCKSWRKEEFFDFLVELYKVHDPLAPELFGNDRYYYRMIFEQSGVVSAAYVEKVRARYQEWKKTQISNVRRRAGQLSRKKSLKNNLRQQKDGKTPAKLPINSAKMSKR